MNLVNPFLRWHRKDQWLCVVVLGAMLAVLSACTERIILSVPPATSVSVYDFDAKTERTIEPNSEVHKRLIQWVSENQDGWKRYAATPPALGAIVRAGPVNLQFVGHQAIVHTGDGFHFKDVSPGSYQFLDATSSS